MPLWLKDLIQTTLDWSNLISGTIGAIIGSLISVWYQHKEQRRANMPKLRFKLTGLDSYGKQPVKELHINNSGEHPVVITSIEGNFLDNSQTEIEDKIINPNNAARFGVPGGSCANLVFKESCLNEYKERGALKIDLEHKGLNYVVDLAIKRDLHGHLICEESAIIK